MPSAPTADAPVAVIGAGPHGLAAVAHLRGAGVPTVAFGEPLGFWRETMPTGMLLRSPLRASSIDSPQDALSLDRWSEEHHRELAQNLPIADFIDYGLWFGERAVADLDRRLVERVGYERAGFVLTLPGGESLRAGRVVVAAGLGPFASLPPAFRGLPKTLVSHTSACAPMDTFAGRSVAVIGGGQSALEGAALLREGGASRVELIARAPAIYWLNHGWIEVGEEQLLPPPKGPSGPPSWRARRGLYWHGAPTDVGGRITSWIGAAPDVVRHFPRSVRSPLTYHCIRPAGAPWLPDRLREVTLTLGRSVVSATPENATPERVPGSTTPEGVPRSDTPEGAPGSTIPEGQRLTLRLDDGSERVVDHVLLGTGYDIDVTRYPFLDEEVISRLRVRDGYPLLGRGLESSLPGLHFLGAPAAESFGPTMRFVVGTAYTAPALTQYVLGQRRPFFRWAF
jgi:FAD-dependent urate hydroxylase